MRVLGLFVAGLSRCVQCVCVRASWLVAVLCTLKTKCQLWRGSKSMTPLDGCVALGIDLCVCASATAHTEANVVLASPPPPLITPTFTFCSAAGLAGRWCILLLVSVAQGCRDESCPFFERDSRERQEMQGNNREERCSEWSGRPGVELRTSCSGHEPICRAECELNIFNHACIQHDY